MFGGLEYMHHLYILKSAKPGWHYIGITASIENRLGKHNAGAVKSTKSRRPFTLLYTESLSDRTTARKREIFLKKNAKARKELFEKINAPIV